jgi:transposase
VVQRRGDRGLESGAAYHPGRQPHYSALAITTALTLRAVFRLALRQTEGLIGSILRLLGLDLAVPDHSTLSRRAETLAVPRPRSDSGSEPMHLLVDSTGLRLCGPSERLTETHGARARRSWKKLHLGVDADTSRIVAAELTGKDADDGARVGPSLDQVDGPVASFTADGAYDRDDVYGAVAARHPNAAVIVPPRSSAVPSGTAETAPSQRDRHLEVIAERGRRGWQKASGYNRRALAEAAIGRFKRVIGDALRSRTDRRQAAEVAIAVRALNRMLELGRPESVRIA